MISSSYACEAGRKLSTQPLLNEFQTILGAAPQEIFAYVSDIDRLAEWIPAAKKSWADNTKAETPGQVGAVRVISAGFGKPTLETIKAYEAPRLLAYSASDKSLFGLVTDHLGVVSCEATDEGHTRLSWLAFGKLATSAPKALCGKLMFRTVLNRGIRNLEKKFPIS